MKAEKDQGAHLFDIFLIGFTSIRVLKEIFVIHLRELAIRFFIREMKCPVDAIRAEDYFHFFWDELKRVVYNAVGILHGAFKF